MSYATEVTADAPIVYYRLAEGSGTTVASSGSANLNGTLVPGNNGQYPLLGAASPLETDAPDRSVYFSGGGGGFSLTHIQVAYNAALDITGSLTIEMWARPRMTPTATLIPLYRGVYSVYYDGNNAWQGRVSIGGITYALDSNRPAAGGVWQHIVMVRSSNVMQMYINGALASERTNVPTGAINTDSSLLQIGGLAGADWVGELDEVAIYGSALSGARILAHYNAGRTAQPIVLPAPSASRTQITLASTPPTDFPFSHNWLEPMRERIEWLTDVISAYEDAEQRVNLRQYPRRTLEYLHTPSNANERARFHAFLWAKHASVLIVPVWSDFAVTGSEIAAGSTSIALDTTLRDYDAESYFVIASGPNYEIAKIAPGGVSAGSLTLTAGLGSTWPAGSVVAPARRATTEEQIKVKSHAGDYEDLSLTFNVLPEDQSANRITAYTPTYTHKGIEVFSLAQARFPWLEDASYEVTQRFEKKDSSVGVHQTFKHDTGSRRTIPVRILLFTRASISSFFGWLEARKGRLNPLWVPSGESDFEFVTPPSGGFSNITVKDTNYRTLYNRHIARRDLAFVRTDGTLATARITAASFSSPNELLSVDTAISGTPAIRNISFLKLCRLATDSVEIEWHRQSTTGEMLLEANLQFVELLTSPV